MEHDETICRTLERLARGLTGALASGDKVERSSVASRCVADARSKLLARGASEKSSRGIAEELFKLLRSEPRTCSVMAMLAGLHLEAINELTGITTSAAAIFLARSLVAIQLRLGEPVQASYSLLPVAEWEIQHGKSGRALRRASFAARTFDASAGCEYEASWAYRLRANALSNLGRFEDALLAVRRSHSLLKGLPESDVDAEFRLLLEEAVLQRKLGDILAALRILKSATHVAFVARLRNQISAVRLNRGICYQMLGETRRGLRDVLSAARSSAKKKQYDRLAKCYNQLGSILSASGDTEQAIKAFAAALHLLDPQRHAPDRARCLLNLCNVKLDQNDNESALRYVTEARELFVKSEAHHEAMRATVLLAYVELKLGKEHDAERLMREVDIRRLGSDDKVQFHTCALLIFKSGRQVPSPSLRASIFTHIRSGIEAAESATTQNIGAGGLFLSRAKTAREFYRIAAWAAQALGEDELFFEILQHAKAKSWRESYLGSLDANEELSFIRSRVIAALGQGEERSANSTLDKANLYFERVSDVLAKKQRRHSPDPPAALSAVQASLPTNWLVIEFWSEAPRLVTAVIVSNKNLVVVKVPEEVCPFSAEELADAIKAPDGRAFSKQFLRKLKQWLFEPLRIDEGTTEGIYLVAHGFLQLLPLHASLTSHGKYLFEIAAVSYLPASHIIVNLPVPNHSLPGYAVINPEKGSRNTLACGMWESDELASMGFSVARVSPSLCDLSVSPLWTNSTIVYITAHGVSEPSLSLASRFRFQDDALLAHDILSRTPRVGHGGLVVANGCKTAKVDLRAIDESFGITAAFLLRGASTCLSTLWRVDELIASLLAIRFTRDVLSGATCWSAYRSSIRYVRSVSVEEAAARLEEIVQRLSEANDQYELAVLEQALWRIKWLAGDAAAETHKLRAIKYLTTTGQAREAEAFNQMTIAAGAPIRTRQPSVFEEPHNWCAYALFGRIH
jgi:CHAT domain-containing protein/tetratricopeptide (TPR) repeat protein